MYNLKLICIWLDCWVEFRNVFCVKLKYKVVLVTLSEHTLSTTTSIMDPLVMIFVLAKMLFVNMKGDIAL